MLGRLWRKPSREIWLDDAQRTHIAVCGGITGKSSLMRALAACDMHKGGPMLIMGEHSDAATLRRAATQCGRDSDFNSAELSDPESLNLAIAFCQNQILHVGLDISGALVNSQRIVAAVQSQLSEIANGRLRMPSSTIRVHLDDQADLLNAQALQLVAHKCGLNAGVALRLSTYRQSPIFAIDAAFSTAIILSVSDQTAELLQGVWTGFDADMALKLPVGEGIVRCNAAFHHVTLPRFDAPPSFTERLSA